MSKVSNAFCFVLLDQGEYRRVEKKASLRSVIKLIKLWCDNKKENKKDRSFTLTIKKGF